MAAHELATEHHAVVTEWALWALWKTVAVVLALGAVLVWFVRWWWPQPAEILPGAQLDETRWPAFTGRLEEA